MRAPPESFRPITGAPPVWVVFGDETFLKQESLDHLRSSVLGQDDGEFSLTEFVGDDALAPEVFDCLSTVALFGAGRRLVIVREADNFVSRHRAILEAYVARPKPSGVLVLEVASWPSNTKLAKAVAAGGLTVECKTPTGQQIAKWLVARTAKQHRARLDRQADTVDAKHFAVELRNIFESYEPISFGHQRTTSHARIFLTSRIKESPQNVSIETRPSHAGS